MAEKAPTSAGSVERGGETTLDMARRCRRRKCNRAADPVLPDVLLLWEILVRVPAMELLRCRAVCRSWRRVTSGAAFLLAHHRRQPSLPLVEFEADGNTTRNTVEALDLQRSPAVRRPVFGFNKHKRYPRDFIYIIEASCDGLILLYFSNHRHLYLCNPATRQWLTLPDLISSLDVAALYPHRPSGEYRILYWKKHSGINDDSGFYYVLTVGSSEERCIGLPVASPSMKNHTTCLGIHGGPRSVLLHDCVYWYDSHGDIFDSKIEIFDTLAESFRWMQPPTAASSADVLQMDGTLGIAHVNVAAMTAEVWVLQDHEKEIWSSKFRVKLPYEEMSKDVKCADDFLGGTVVSGNGHVMVMGDNPLSGSLFHCDSKGKLLEKFILQNFQPIVLGLYFKESLVRHPFFGRKDGRRTRMPRCFRGLY